MAKYLLVIDIPDDLFEYYENFYVDYDLRADRKNAVIVESVKYVEEAKIKPMPERINSSKLDGRHLLELGYMHGRNDLINEIEKIEE